MSSSSSIPTVSSSSCRSRKRWSRMETSFLGPFTAPHPVHKDCKRSPEAKGDKKQDLATRVTSDMMERAPELWAGP